MLVSKVRCGGRACATTVLNAHEYSNGNSNDMNGTQVSSIGLAGRCLGIWVADADDCDGSQSFYADSVPALPFSLDNDVCSMTVLDPDSKSFHSGWSNDIGDVGATALAHALPQSKVTSLS